MTRISSAASNTLVLEQIFKTQKRVLDRQLQATTEKKSQDYKGIAYDSRRLVNLENERNLLSRFISTNEQVDVKLQVQETAMQSLQETISTFRDELQSFGSGNVKDRERVEFVQTRAIEALKSLNFLLNTEVDGRFMFGGSRSTQTAVDLGISTKSAFQTTYDGKLVKVPTTRDAQLENFSFDQNSSQAKNWLTFSRVDGTSGKSSVLASSAQFANVTAGSTITISGTGSNDGTYEVAAVRGSGTIIDIVTTQLTDETGATDIIVTYPNADNPATPNQFTANLSFTQSSNTITSSVAGALTNIPVGSAFTLSGTSSNDGTYTIASNDGTNLVIESKRFTNEAGAGPTFSFTAASNMTFVDGGGGADSIVAPAGTFVDSTGASLAAGTTIRISGTGTANDGKTFTIASVGGGNSTATLVSGDVVTAATNVSGTASNSAYFQFTAAANLDFVDGGTAADTIVAPAGTFVDGSGNPLQAGTKLSIAGTGDANAGQVYTIALVSSDNSTVTLVSTDAVTAGASLNGTVTVSEGVGTVASTSYYKGDLLTSTHRVDDDRSFTIDLNAANSAFEKAIRAIKIIAQGEYGTAGGLDQNSTRIADAMYLLDSALDNTAEGSPPYGTEQTGNIEQVTIDIGFQRVLINQTNAIHKDFIGFLDGSISQMENTDITETLTKMLDDQRALEASFQVFARIRQLSLTNFL
jgi:flagellar hook-associated protein 3 FlgL